MPRTAGVSGNSATRPILLSFNPISVERCEWWRRIGLPVCSTLIVFAALAIVSTPKSASARCLVSRNLGIAADAARLQRGDLDVATRRDRARRVLLLQRVEGRANHVVGVRRADRLRHHVRDAERLEHGAHRAASDDAGTGRSCTQIDAAGAMAAGDVVM